MGISQMPQGSHSLASFENHVSVWLGHCLGKCCKTTLNQTDQSIVMRG